MLINYAGGAFTRILVFFAGNTARPSCSLKSANERLLLCRAPGWEAGPEKGGLCGRFSAGKNRPLTYFMGAFGVDLRADAITG
ncbi:hypothetical protein GCM10027299_48790 [Larkinella ripae]